MTKSQAFVILIILLALMLVILFAVGFCERQPTRQDDATVWEVPDSLVKGPSVKATMVENCYGLDLGIEIFDGNMLKDWRKKQLELCENYSDIRVVFDGREFLFSYEEFKAVLIQNSRDKLDVLRMLQMEPFKIVESELILEGSAKHDSLLKVFEKGKHESPNQ